MDGINTDIKVDYMKDGILKTSTIEAFTFTNFWAVLYLENGDTIMEHEVIQESK